MDRCDSCSFVYADVEAAALPARLAAFGTQYRTLLLPPGRSAAWFGILRTRPEGRVVCTRIRCHVRDVFLVQRDRLYTALVEDTPTFTPMYRDQRVTLARYNAQDLRRWPSNSPLQPASSRRRLT